MIRTRQSIPMRRVALFAAESSANWVIKTGFEDIVGAFILFV
jgi:hypothetical protein